MADIAALPIAALPPGTTPALHAVPGTLGGVEEANHLLN